MRLLTALAVCLAATMGWAETRVLFVAKPTVSGTNEIYTMKSDGTDLRRVTTNSVAEWSPTLSPDGTRIAYAATNGVKGVYLTTLGGAAPTLVCTGDVRAVQWAATNSLMYVKLLTSGYCELWKVSTNGTGNAKAYTSTFTDYNLGVETFFINRSAGRVYVPVLNLSSFKSRINSGLVSAAAFDSTYAVLSPLDSGASDYYTPAVSPDGTRLAYAADYGAGEHRVWVSSLSGTGTATEISAQFSASPAWAPDSTWLVCVVSGNSTYGEESYVGNLVRYGLAGTNLNSNLTASLSIAGRCACPSIYQVSEDADADGMPDAWESQYFGSTSATNGAASADRDEDGIPNLDEYLAGTNPTNGTDSFRVQMLETNGGLFVSYRAVSTSNALYTGKSRYYDLLCRTSLVDGAWAPVAGQTNLVGSDSQRQYSVPATNETLLYRVRARLQ